MLSEDAVRGWERRGVAVSYLGRFIVEVEA